LPAEAQEQSAAVKELMKKTRTLWTKTDLPQAAKQLPRILTVFYSLSSNEHFLAYYFYFINMQGVFHLLSDKFGVIHPV
jgi:hypothetical protein